MIVDFRHVAVTPPTRKVKNVTDLHHDAAGALSISAVERDTGLSKDVLRVWERRYGFPQPLRDEHGERLYPMLQVERLRAIKRLMDAGHRPGKLLALSENAFAVLAREQEARRSRDSTGDLQREIFARIHAHDMAGLRRRLTELLIRHGLHEFVSEIVIPLSRAVAEGWMRGELQLYHERAWTEQVRLVLQTLLSTLPPGAAPPRVLLTTLPNEPSTLGLTTLEAMLAAEGAAAVSLGPQTPIPEIVAAAEAFHADVVLLSFSPAYGSKQAAVGVEALRSLLPATRALWIGGDLVRRIRRDLAGVSQAAAPRELVALLRQWRVLHEGATELSSSD
jgi:DNA-binding transcriptional MerR regulator/methylmalonyl-CoA mutase cobalamin-binding subunit